MNNNDLKNIPERIGYSFKDFRLLKQAFTRSSYAKEHPGTNNNEVLEFIGDKALEAVVMNELITFFSYINDNGEFVCKENEGKLTDIKKRLVDEEMLAHRIEILGFNEYLLMGNGDIINKVKDQPSVKCDLFEAIIGAVAIDSNWDFNALKRVTDKMLDVNYYLDNQIVSEENNYIGLIQEWYQKNYKDFPPYEFKEVNDNGKKQFVCTLKTPKISNVFQGIGDSKQAAKLKVAKALYDFINKKSKKAKINKDNKKKIINSDPVSSLTRLIQTKSLEIGEYSYSRHKGKNGFIWECYLDYDGKQFKGKGNFKKDAKKDVADKVLKEFNKNHNLTIK